MRIALIGKNSFLAGALLAAPGIKDVAAFSHTQALHENLSGFDAIINCAFDPALKTGAYDPARDIDRAIAECISGAQTHYVMLSSRLVYGPRGRGDCLLKETDAPNPQSYYAAAKHETEMALPRILGASRVSILRMGNIFGAETGRETFMGRALAGLKTHGEIIFDMNDDCLRDFRSAQSWAQAVWTIAARQKGGVFNLGAGFGISVREVAETLIAAKSAGRLIVRPEKPEDSFVLDMTKTNATLNLPPYTKEILLRDLKSLIDQ